MPIYKNLTKFRFKCIKRSRFEKRFSPDFLEFTLVFLHIFLDFFKKLKNSKFKLKITDSNLEPDGPSNFEKCNRFFLTLFQSLVPCYAGTRKVLRSPPHPASATETAGHFRLRVAIKATSVRTRAGPGRPTGSPPSYAPAGPALSGISTVVVQCPTCYGPCLALSD
jgi:hypothetical protein